MMRRIWQGIFIFVFTFSGIVGVAGAIAVIPEGVIGLGVFFLVMAALSFLAAYFNTSP